MASLGNCMSPFLSFMRISMFGLSVRCNGMFPSQNRYLSCICKHSHPNIVKFQVNMWKAKVLATQSCLTLCHPMDCSPPGSLSTEFSRQEYWSEKPFPSPGDLPDPGIEPRTCFQEASVLLTIFLYRENVPELRAWDRCFCRCPAYLQVQPRAS